MARNRPKVFVGDAFSQVTNDIIAAPVTPVISDFKDELPLLGEESSITSPAAVYTSVILNIPQSLKDEYSKVAAAQEMTVEEVIQHRLVRCKNHNSLRGLWFSDFEHAQLEKLLKKCPIDTASQALNLLQQASGVDLGDIKVSLSIPQRKVLTLRAKHGLNPQQIFEAMLRREFQV